MTGIAEKGSIRRCDIIVLDRKNNIGYILDPTIRYETKSTQPDDVDKEKKLIYEDTTKYYKEKYQINSFEVIGLFIGARGTISKFFMNFCKRFKLGKDILHTISLTTIRFSVNILRNHLYSD